jgi:hypothetical protein
MHSLQIGKTSRLDSRGPIPRDFTWSTQAYRYGLFFRNQEGGPGKEKAQAKPKGLARLTGNDCPAVSNMDSVKLNSP